MFPKYPKKPEKKLKDYEGLLSYGMWLLGRSDMFEAKMLAKLISYAKDDKEAHKALERFIDLNYINDDRLTLHKMRSALETGKKGLRRVVADLTRQQAPRASINKAVDVIKAEQEEGAETQACVEYYQQRFGSKPLPTDRDAFHKERQRRMSHLVRRGFSFGDAAKALEAKDKE